MTLTVNVYIFLLRMGAMLPEQYQWIGVEFEPEGDWQQLLDIARELEDAGDLNAAALVYDRAFGICPQDKQLQRERRRLLDELSLTEHGLHFRYIPGGVFLMGDNQAETDERPWHPVWLSPFWLTETPVSWADFCRLAGWSPPPEGMPPDDNGNQANFDRERFSHMNDNKVRLQYCENHTKRAQDWHAHYPNQQWQTGGQTHSAQDLFGHPQRDDADAEWRYDAKPMVAVNPELITPLGNQLSTASTTYALPTEAQWEKAARGGLIGARYPWGDHAPTAENCDCNRFHQLSIQTSKTFAANGYGLYAMSGGVWEWTCDWYDRDAYSNSKDTDPGGPDGGEEKVLRGGSWADCSEAMRVSFRMSREPRYYGAPNIGFRLSRMEVSKRFANRDV